MRTIDLLLLYLKQRGFIVERNIGSSGIITQFGVVRQSIKLLVNRGSRIYQYCAVYIYDNNVIQIMGYKNNELRSRMPQLDSVDGLEWCNDFGAATFGDKRLVLSRVINLADPDCLDVITDMAKLSMMVFLAINKGRNKALTYFS